jgi:hypothetical protein
MKRIYAMLAAVALCMASCKKDETTTTTTTTTEDTTTKQKDTTGATAAQQPVDSIGFQKAWEAYATPGDMHKLLAEETGKWDVTMTFWMSADGKPETSNATAETKMIMGGRYQETLYKGNMMGMEWEGKSTVAYNNKNKLFTSTFIDNSGTGMMVAVGSYKTADKAIHSKGEMADIVTGNTILFREVYTIVDANTRKMEMFDTKPGEKEYKSMEIVMRRK